MMLRLVFIAVLLSASFGCQLIPDVAHQPAVHNPFPQLSRVAVAPFFNHSDDETVDGREFALAYYGELQAIPGFEVVPLSVVEEAMLGHRLALNNPEEVRRLAEVLNVDAVAIGAVTDFSPYYPPRCGLRVEWYTANRGFHAIPPGYGLPWGTPDEEFIPAPLVFEAEMALAREQLKTQTPICHSVVSGSQSQSATQPGKIQPGPADDGLVFRTGNRDPAKPVEDPFAQDDAIQLAQAIQKESVGNKFESPDGSGQDMGAGSSEAANGAPAGRLQPHLQAIDSLPAGWPDERGFIPPGPSPVRPCCCPYSGPVMTHTQIYHGNDAEFTEALASYYHFRDDARFGGWQSYLQRSDDFIRFCCHLHILEMLTARGGGGETRVVWRWSESR